MNRTHLTQSRFCLNSSRTEAVKHFRDPSVSQEHERSKNAAFHYAVYCECIKLLREVTTAYGYRPAVLVNRKEAASWIGKKLDALNEPINSELIGIDNRSIAMDSLRLLIALVAQTSGSLNPDLVNWRGLEEFDKADAYRAAAIYLSFASVTTLRRDVLNAHPHSAAKKPEYRGLASAMEYFL